jgi:hypothetical protein
MLHSPFGRRIRLPRLAARTNALYPARLSPEGHDLATMKRLTRALLAQGLRVFSLSLHSPTLQVGNTPYTQTADELAQLFADLDSYLAFFRTEIGGRFVGPSEIRAGLLAGRDSAAA